MGTVDRNCGTLAAGAGPWRALTASLLVVACCFVWLCIRQCHELILKSRAEQSRGAGARAFAWVTAAANQARHSFLTVTGHEIRAMLNPALGLTTIMVIPLLDAQPRMPIEATFESSDNLLYALNASLDFSRLETARLVLEQRAFSAESLADQAVSMADVWTDQQLTGSWMADFAGDRDIFWHDANVMPALAAMDGFNMPSGDNVGINPGPAWQAHGAIDLHSDDTPASWLMDGLDLVSDSDVGFIPVSDGPEIQPYYDLI